MLEYVIRRLLEGLVLLFLVSIALFTITYSLGDPLAILTDGGRPPEGAEADRMRRQMGLDQPIPLQYLYWLVGNDWALIDADGDGDTDENIYGARRGLLRGDLGRSLITREPAFDRVADRFPNTLILVIPSYLLVLTLALAIGIHSALRPNSPLDVLLNGLAFFGYSVPIYLVCLGLIYIFAVQFRRWGIPNLPVAGMWDVTQPRNATNLLSHMVLPVASLTIVQVAVYIRFIRSAVLEIITQDYVRTAHAKGLARRRVIGLHVMKPASLPLITLIGLDLPVLLGGAVLTETIFAWPGMGSLFLESLNRADYPVLMAILIFISALVIIFQLLTDIVYTLVDPRIQLTEAAR
jgi:peptide/nickel transport system permease protein